MTQRRNKPLLTKENIDKAGTIASKFVKDLKNRKIRKLEKETMQNIQKAHDLAHKIKTMHANKDALNDIKRYEQELKRMAENEK